jgi:hypothetical protein
MNGLRILVVIALAAVGLGAASSALAQYPQPAGSCTVSFSPSNPAPNSTVTVTVSVLTNQGGPASGVQGTASVSGGSGASITPTFTTGADGKATLTLQTGSSVANLTVSVVCGAANTSAVLGVGATQQPGPPSTGQGSAAGDSSSFPVAWAAALVAAVAILGTGTAVVARRRL